MLASSIYLLWLASHQAAKYHPILDLYDLQTLQQAYDKGRKVAEHIKNADDALPGRFRKNIGKVRSPDGADWWPPHCIIWTPTAYAYWKGWNDGKDYNPRYDALHMFKPYENSILSIQVNTAAWPGVSDWDLKINRQANPDDVRDLKFVLFVDGNRENPIKPIVANNTGNTSGSGSLIIPEIKTQSVNVTTSGTGGYSDNTSSVTYNTFVVNNYSCYTASYNLLFNFNSNGKSLLPPTAKTLELLIIYRSGEHYAKFNLDELADRNQWR